MSRCKAVGTLARGRTCSPHQTGSEGERGGHLGPLTPTATPNACTHTPVGWTESLSSTLDPTANPPVSPIGCSSTHSKMWTHSLMYQGPAQSANTFGDSVRSCRSCRSCFPRCRFFGSKAQNEPFFISEIVTPVGATEEGVLSILQNKNGGGKKARGSALQCNHSRMNSPILAESPHKNLGACRTDQWWRLSSPSSLRRSAAWPGGHVRWSRAQVRA